MKKFVLALVCAAALTLTASASFADMTEPTHPCVKPEQTDARSISNYESCMAEFIASQKTSISNHEAALRKAEAAMERTGDMGGK